MLTLGVLCSGGLGLDTLTKLALENDIKFVLTDNNSKAIIAFAQKNKIPVFAGNPREGKGYQFIKSLDVDVITSINYLFLIENDIVNHPSKLIFNIHGSLLPKYRGRTPHVWAIINGETKAGITAHIIDSGCDTGAIIHQKEIAINLEDTGADVLEKYMEVYFPLVKSVLEDIEQNNLNLKEQDETKATYFGKRTPDDGGIDWRWSSEKIRNWVRAQATPYPGAFTFFKGIKITIDKVSFSKIETLKSQKEGEIIMVNPNIIVKTRDGALKLDSVRELNCIFNIGNKFNNEDWK